MSQYRESFASQSESGSSCDIGHMRGKGHKIVTAIRHGSSYDWWSHEREGERKR